MGGNNYPVDYGSGCNGSIGFIVFIIIIFLLISLFFATFVGRKAEKEGHSFITWAILGFFFGLIALLALHIATIADSEGHNFKLWAVLGFFFNIGALIMLETGLIAERKLYDFTSYCVLAGAFGLIALVISCILPKVTYEKVVVVNKPEVKESALLKSYHSSYKPTTTKTSWTCESCGQLNVAQAQRCINCYAEKPKQT